jgi:hypothetical protein
LHHACKQNLWPWGPVELIHAVIFECPGDFNGTVTTEVEEDDTVVVGNRADRLTLVGDNKGR